MPTKFANPQEIAAAGQRIYEEFRERYESQYPGQFVAIDVTTGAAYVAPQPEDAIKKAKEKAPEGIFHLIRIGSSGAFRVGYVASAHSEWFV